MSYVVRFTVDSKIDVDDAVDWYRRKSPAYATRFARAVDRTLDLIEAMPNSFPKADQIVRVAKTRKFPYGIYFEIDGDEILIIAVCHLSRDSRVWKSRKIQ